MQSRSWSMVTPTTRFCVAIPGSSRGHSRRRMAIRAGALTLGRPWRDGFKASVGLGLRK